MKLCGVHLGDVDDVFVRQLRRSAVTYDHVRSTLVDAGTTPSRFEQHMTVGSDVDDYRAARTALRTWRPQRALGASITPSEVRPDLDETVVLRFGIGRARITVPTRIVATVDEQHRYGYAYGTLPGHPEAGEELFLLERRPGGDVVLTIRVDAAPAPQLLPLGPLIRPLQHAAIRRYLTAVASHVERSRSPR